MEASNWNLYTSRRRSNRRSEGRGIDWYGRGAVCGGKKWSPSCWWSHYGPAGGTRPRTRLRLALGQTRRTGATIALRAVCKSRHPASKLRPISLTHTQQNIAKKVQTNKKAKKRGLNNWYLWYMGTKWSQMLT